MTDPHGLRLDDITRLPGPTTGSVSARLLLKRLMEGKVGDTITDEELQRVCGDETFPGGKAYGALLKAIKWCIEKKRLYWEREHGANAIVCRDNEKKLHRVERERKGIQRRSKRALSVAETVELDKLAESERPMFSATVAQLGTLVVFAGKDTTKKLTARAVSEPLDMQKLLGAMQS